MGVGPTSRSSMVPGWKGGKALPFGGSFGEYSLNDFEEQPGQAQPTDIFTSPAAGGPAESRCPPLAGTGRA